MQLGIDDVPAEGHISPEDRARIIAGYPEHETEARSRGEPMLGEGKVYQTPESRHHRGHRSAVDFPIYWRWGYGMDMGMDHPVGLRC